MTSQVHNPSPPPVRALPATGPNEAGLTLVECIMAIVVVGVVGAVIAPMMAISVATRVQSQKAEQSLALAQSEIDRVRIMIEQGDLPNPVDTETGQITLADQQDPGFESDFWPVNDLDNITDNRAANVPGPASLTDNNTTLREVDINDDGEADFVVQSYLVENADAENTYDMGVRVYDYRAVANATAALPTDEALLGITNNEGERGSKPMAALYTNLGTTEDLNALCNWIDYTDEAGDADRPASCN